MRNSKDENLSEHSLETSIIAHALCIIKNKKSLPNDRLSKITY